MTKINNGPYDINEMRKVKKREREGEGKDNSNADNDNLLFLCHKCKYLLEMIINKYLQFSYNYMPLSLPMMMLTHVYMCIHTQIC